MTPVMTYAAEVVDPPLDEIAAETTNITQSQEMDQSVTIFPDITQRKLNVEKIGDSYYFYELSYEISNDVALKIPRTGSNGVRKYGFIGICILSGAAIFVIYKKKKNVT